MKLNIVRAWKDEIYRQSLSDEQMDMVPANPVGELELTDTSLQFIYGSGGGGGGGFVPGGGGMPGGGMPGRGMPGGGMPGRGMPGVSGGILPGLHAIPHGHEVIAAAAGAHALQSRFHSLSLRGCNEEAFSLTISDGFNFLSPVNTFCINEED